MSDTSRDSKSSGLRPWIGAFVGGIIGGLGRFLVTIGFVYYVTNWGGPFFRDQGDIGVHLVPFYLISAGIGLVVGWIGAATCRPILGAVIGGGLSGAFCVGLFFVPANLAIALSGGGVVDYSKDQIAIAVGLVAMIVVGALAGGIGAAIGKARPSNA